ncbi:hypothetical protein PGT21_002205 [Puccinia graminis f. sp. tritici]|uniref:Inositol-1-monophosphatase n=1 Tax=Puccinia graminis f. sp. tritici TaxID=56615 RepID=A0A5B0SHU6_PUCGR|nr:hypothetical protein PGTUg99_002866 [Puccinia graminis f. sp. tritici]KAA1071286.1 hypothetical protein PGT21_002205 [Puccinia graminis f. sp. tritici]KAA1137452.1 hypothetical protein PGTUg99_015909 [Puccinia graminis f. sp. tritici]
MATHPSYEVELDFAVKLAMKAGEIILRASKDRAGGRGGTINDKKNRIDLVTETDQMVEKMVSESLRDKFPDHQFIGEETFAVDAKAELTNAPTWICDPVDGTTNFVHGFPSVCISIGWVVNKIPTLGVIYNPFLSQLYTAVKGHGAFFNQKTRLPSSYPDYLPLEKLSDALVGVEWGSDRSKATLEKKTNTFVKLAGDPKDVPGGVMCHSLRSMGSAALNYASVASGSLDLYWEIGCWAWDVCAGTVIALEAGGKCYGKGGKPFDADGSGQDLMGHHFFVIRGIADQDGVTGSEIQDRLAKQFFDEIAEEWEA